MCFFKSSTQQRSFNCPYQLGNCVGGDCPEAAEEFEAGTDGLLDNIFASEIEEVIVAYEVSGQDCDKYNVSPFQMEVQKAGREHVGGKIDDITVVVARVLASTKNKNKNKNIYKKLSIERNTGTTTRAYSLQFQFHIGERHKAFDVPCQNAFLRYNFSCFRNSANLAKRFLECAT
ncbi:PREDICTED: probable phosphatase 2C [Prunus dulcis]|uniref:Protein phosphatase n=1 Tax=Prunus dulcis TaxID=3755 RepID=A0A5E4FPP0_PRUDU|nr:PREDICTED: probable phosphatase 2C [Prunus dulcis]